jgi:hypothetical protein
MESRIFPYSSIIYVHFFLLITDSPKGHEVVGLVLKPGNRYRAFALEKPNHRRQAELSDITCEASWAKAFAAAWFSQSCRLNDSNFIPQRVFRKTGE